MTDYGHCAYYRYAVGRGPRATCSFGCHEEPACVTEEPERGWPSWRGGDPWSSASRRNTRRRAARRRRWQRRPLLPWWALT